MEYTIKFTGNNIYGVTKKTSLMPPIVFENATDVYDYIVAHRMFIVPDHRNHDIKDYEVYSGFKRLHMKPVYMEARQYQHLLEDFDVVL